jgi:hypothetical protein
MGRIFNILGQWKRSFDQGCQGYPPPQPIREKVLGCSVDWWSQSLVLPCGEKLTREFLEDIRKEDVEQWIKDKSSRVCR